MVAAFLEVDRSPLGKKYGKYIQGRYLLSLLSIRSGHLEILGFPVGGAY